MIKQQLRSLVVCATAAIAGVTVAIPAAAVGASSKTGRVAAATGAAGDLAVIAGRTLAVQPGSATATPLGARAVAVASNGDLYIADTLNNVVEKVTPSGALSVIAGVVGRQGAPTLGPATSSDLDDPDGVAVDSGGDVYIADSGNNVVEKVTPSGDLSIIAGAVGRGGAPTPGLAASSDLADPRGVAVDSSGNVYIADSFNDVVEKVTPSGYLSIFAGVVGRSGAPTPGAATSSDLAGPAGVAIDASGDVFIADQGNNMVERVTSAGDLSIIAGVVGRFGAPTPGPATSSALYQPAGVAVDAGGNVYIADFQGSVVEKVSSAGTLSVIAGTSNWGAPTMGLATSSDLGFPNGVAVDASGNVYVADAFNDVVEKVTPSATLSIAAGTSSWGSPTPGLATSSDLGNPYGVAVDASGNVYVADTFNNVVEKLTPAGVLSVIAGVVGQQGKPTPGPATSSDLDNPRGVSVDSSGNVYIADSGNGVVEKVTPSGTLSIVAGTDDSLGDPTGVAVDSSGDVYIADGVVEKVTPSGALSVIAGTGGAAAVAVDASGAVYVVEPGANEVERVAPSGALSVIAGTGVRGAPTPGPATSSDLDDPVGVAVDSSGSVYIADSGNSMVEKVTPSGTLSIVAGTGVQGAPAPGLAISSDVNWASGVAVDASSDLYIADTINNDIEEVFATPTGTGTTTTGTTTTIGTTPTHSYTPPSVAQVLKSLAPTLTPAGAGAKIENLLKAGGFTTSFKAPSPGVLSIVWQVTVVKNHEKSLVTIASGKLTATGADGYSVKVKLTAAGESDLKSARTLKITVKSSFTPKGAKQTTASKTVTLKR